MSTMRRFAISRLWAIVVKEFIQMRRDRVTFGMMIGVPLIQLVLFGYAINADPKRLPTAVLLAEAGLRAALMNVLINLPGHPDPVAAAAIRERARDLGAEGDRLRVADLEALKALDAGR